MIPKSIYQTFYTKLLPTEIVELITKTISNNSGYEYYLFDDIEMREFVKVNSDEEFLMCYDSLNVGAAKADLWRYLILYKLGGVYLYIDSEIHGNLNDFIRSEDCAIITREGHPNKFVQWCLMFAPNHPILKICLDMCIKNIKERKILNIIDLTGPTVFSDAISEYCKTLGINIWSTNDDDLNKMFKYHGLDLRIYSTDFQGYCNFKNRHYLLLENYNIRNSKPRHWTEEKKIFL
jgi:mannosyltransferase OCH1-like enzyme